MPVEGIPSNSNERNQNHSLMHFHNGTMISTTFSDESKSDKTEDDPNHSQSPILEAPEIRLASLPLRNAHGAPRPPKQ